MRKSIRFIIFIIFIIFIPVQRAWAVSPTATPIASPSASPIPASPTASQGGPTTTEDEKAREIRESAQATIASMKEKIEKKAYVGVISEITDSTITVTNFRGKQRIRIAEATTIIGASKKEIPVKELAVEDKIIALGEPDNNKTLEAKRVIVVPPPKTASPKRLVFFGTISAVNTKSSSLTIASNKNLDQTLEIKIDKTTNLANQKDPKTEIKFKDFQEGQKLVAVYPEPAEGKTSVAKTIFLLP